MAGNPGTIYPRADVVEFVAARRARAHIENTTRRFFDDKLIEERLGVAGEQAFAELYECAGLQIDMAARPFGDDGIDFHHAVLGSVDIKVARKAYNLLVKVHEVARVADTVVQARVVGEWPKLGVQFLGWGTGRVFKTCPTRDFGYGIVSHYLPIKDLLPMRILDRVLGRD